MGKQFLTVTGLLFLFVQQSGGARAWIELTPPPVRVLPPKISEEEKEADFQRLKNRRRKKSRRKKSSFQWKVDQQKKKLRKNAHKDHQYRLMLQVSLVYPTVLVSGPRKRYTSEITSHFCGLMRLESLYKPGEWQTWIGMRAAPFSGSGQYSETVGRYGYLYFGPMVALGKISAPALKKVTQAGTTKERTVPVGAPVRSGWMLMSGIAVQSRQGQSDPTDDFTSKDLDTVRGFKFDSPGLWLEMTWFKIHYGQLGMHWTAGVQTGEGKNFIWIGAAMGGWL